METIYDHNPTREELEAIGCSSNSLEWFHNQADEETVWFSLALLFRLRRDTENEARAWSHIPEARDEFLRGFDCVDIEG